MGKDDLTKIPNGAAGIENRLGLLYTAGVHEGRLDLNEFVNVFATQPAKIFGLYPRKGSIVLGGDADIVVYDPKGESTISAKTHHHRCDRSIFEGFKVKGKATHVIVNASRPIQRRQARREEGRRPLPSENHEPRDQTRSTPVTQKKMTSAEVRAKHKEFLFPSVANYYAEPVVLDSGKGMRARRSRRQPLPSIR